MMKVTVRQLVLASAIGALTLAAHAHGNAGAGAAATRDQNAAVAAASDQDATAPMTPKMTGDNAAQAESRYEAAQAACGQQTGDAKATCLRNAATEYENAVGGRAEPSGASGPASMSSGRGTEGAGETSGAGNGGGR